MEVIVNEDQLSLAIGKRGQNVRLATKLVGWNIDIRSEEEIKREVTEQMGALIASGEAVPLSVIEGVTAQQAEALSEHGINDIDALAQTSVDDLVEFLDLSLDEAEVILNAAQAVIAMRNRSLNETEAAETPEETNAVSAEFDESVDEEVKPSDAMTNEGYDEAVEKGVPYHAEPEINAWESADPVSLTEAEPLPADEIALQEAGRDLRPDTITPSPDITSSGVEAFENIEEAAEEVMADEDFASDGDAAEAEGSTPAVSEETASSGSVNDDENQ
jgi:N utilization substance protein A